MLLAGCRPSQNTLMVRASYLAWIIKYCITVCTVQARGKIQVLKWRPLLPYRVDLARSHEAQTPSVK